MDYISMGIGMIIGMLIGMFLMAALAAAGRADELAERDEKLREIRRKAYDIK